MIEGYFIFFKIFHHFKNIHTPGDIMHLFTHLRRSGVFRFIRRSSLLASLTFISALPVLSWVYPEHRDILLEAIGMLDQDRMTTLNRLAISACRSRRTADGIHRPDRFGLCKGRDRLSSSSLAGGPLLLERRDALNDPHVRLDHGRCRSQRN